MRSKMQRVRNGGWDGGMGDCILPPYLPHEAENPSEEITYQPHSNHTTIT